MALTAREKVGYRKTWTTSTDVLSWTALATTGVAFEIGKDNQTVFLIKNTHASTADTGVKICKGDGIQGVADYVPIASLAAGEEIAVRLDAGEFKNVTGTNKGGVLIKGAADTKVCVIELI